MVLIDLAERPGTNQLVVLRASFARSPAEWEFSTVVARNFDECWCSDTHWAPTFKLGFSGQRSEEEGR